MTGMIGAGTVGIEAPSPATSGLGGSQWDGEKGEGRGDVEWGAKPHLLHLRPRRESVGRGEGRRERGRQREKPPLPHLRRWGESVGLREGSGGREDGRD